MTHSGPPRTHAGAWALVTILLLVAVLGTLLVPIYARSSPKLGSLPVLLLVPAALGTGRGAADDDLLPDHHESGAPGA